MVEDLGSVQPQAVRGVRVSANRGRPDVDRADVLRQFLEKIIYWKDVDQLLLRAREVRLREQPAPGGLELHARLVGEEIDPRKHALGTDVKAVTYHHLRVWQEGKRWKAVVVVDT
jgi:SHS2 domain-containing protein